MYFRGGAALFGGAISRCYSCMTVRSAGKRILARQLAGQLMWMKSKNTKDALKQEIEDFENTVLGCKV